MKTNRNKKTKVKSIIVGKAKNPIIDHIQKNNKKLTLKSNKKYKALTIPKTYLKPSESVLDTNSHNYNKKVVKFKNSIKNTPIFHTVKTDSKVLTGYKDLGEEKKIIKNLKTKITKLKKEKIAAINNFDKQIKKLERELAKFLTNEI